MCSSRVVSGGLECRLLFPGDSVPRQVALDTKKRLEVLLKQPFLLPLDRRLLMRLYMITSREQASLNVAGPGGYLVVREMLESERCFGPGSDEPLRWRDVPALTTADWALVEGERQQPLLTTDEGSVVATSPLLVFHQLENEVGPAGTALPVQAALSWLRCAPLDPTSAADRFRRLCRSFPDTEFPPPPWIHTRSLDGVKPRFVLDVQPATDLEWTRQPVGRLRFDYRGEWIESGADARVRCASWNTMRLTEIPRDLDHEARAEADLTRCGLTRVEFPGDSQGWVPAGGAGAWHEFLAEHQSSMEAEGWSFRFDRERSLRIVEEEAGYVDIQPAGDPERFELEIGVAVRGTRLNLLPWLHQILREQRGKTYPELRQKLQDTCYFLPVAPGETWLFPGGTLRR